MHGRLHIFPHPEQVAEHRLEIDWHRIAAMVFRCISKMKREQEVGNNCSSQIVVGQARSNVYNACLSNFQRCVIDSFLNNDIRSQNFLFFYCNNMHIMIKYNVTLYYLTSKSNK